MLSKFIGAKGLLAFFLALLIGLAAASGNLSYAASNRGLDALARDLDKAGRNLCRSLKLKCRSVHSHPAKKRHIARRGKTVVAKPVQNPVEAAAPAAPSVSATVVVPPAPKALIVAKKTDAVVIVPPDKIAERLKPETPAQKNLTIITPTAAAEPPKPKVDMKLAALSPKEKTIARLVAEPASKKKAAKTEPEVPAAQKLASITTDDLPPPSADETCLTSLRNSKVEFETVAAPEGNASCRVDSPVKLKAMMAKTGRVTFPDQPILGCRFAQQFALWLSDTGAATVATQLNSKLAKVATGPGFECRNRNGDVAGKLSEHALGDAVDITNITTADGKKYEVADALDPASPTQPALRGLRRSACGYFSTVLGPGANTAHAKHFHFDMATRGRSKNYRICQ